MFYSSDIIMMDSPLHDPYAYNLNKPFISVVSLQYLYGSEV